MELKVIALPKVTRNNNLEFDPCGPVPESLPYFDRDPVNPCLFRPRFQECKFRGLIEKPLTNYPTCTRKRNVWYCSHFQKEVFPLDCSGCTDYET